MKNFNAKWSEDRNTAPENHRKRVEQQRALHADPLMPNLSQLVPHTNLKDIQTPGYWNIQFRTLENLENTYPKFWDKTVLWTEAKQSEDNKKGKGVAKGQGKPADNNKNNDKDPRQETYPTEPKAKAKGKGKRDYDYEHWRSQYPVYSDRWNWNQSSGGASASGWQDSNRYWRLYPEELRYTDETLVDPSGLPQVGPSGPNNNYQMAPQAHSNTEAGPSGPHRNWPIGHKHNLFSPSGSYAGPPGPYKSWPIWRQQILLSPSGSHAGPPGPQHIPDIPNTYHNEIQKDPPMQPEVPTEAEGAPRKTERGRTCRGTQSQDQSRNQI